MTVQENRRDNKEEGPDAVSPATRYHDRKQGKWQNADTLQPSRREGEYDQDRDKMEDEDSVSNIMESEPVEWHDGKETEGGIGQMEIEEAIDTPSEEAR